MRGEGYCATIPRTLPLNQAGPPLPEFAEDITPSQPLLESEAEQTAASSPAGLSILEAGSWQAVSHEAHTCVLSGPQGFLLLFFLNVNWLPTFKNQEILHKNADFKLLLKNLSIRQCWAHNPQPQRRLQWAVLPLLMELCSGLKAPCTTRQSLQPNLHGHLNPTLQVYDFFSYLDVPLWRHCSRPASPERSSTDQCGH